MRTDFREFQVVSAPFASGVAWLINVLLELNIRTTHVAPQWLDHWQADGAVDRINPAALAHLRWHLPVLHRHQSFVFAPRVEVFWEHRLDFARYSHRPTLVFVRDPRDAVYSIYERHHAQCKSLPDYLSRPDVWPDHFPGMFGLPPAETWACWHWFWLALAPVMNVKFIRFEAMRERPVEHLKEILEFIGLHRSSEQIERALEQSTFECAKAAMERLETETGKRFRTARRGKVGEWKEVYDAAALRYFEGPASDVMQTLGYDPVTCAASSGSETKLVDLVEDQSVVMQVRRAEGLRRTGEFQQAAALLREVIVSAEPNRRALLYAANALTALQWTRKVFGDELAASPAGQAAHDGWYEFNERFLEWPSIRNMMVDVSRMRALPTEAPQLVEEGFCGFNLVRYADRFYALAQSLGPFDLVSATGDTLQEHQSSRRCFVGNSLSEVKQRIERSV